MQFGFIVTSVAFLYWFRGKPRGFKKILQIHDKLIALKNVITDVQNEVVSVGTLNAEFYRERDSILKEEIKHQLYFLNG